jgi:predicted oxidoreductase
MQQLQLHPQGPAFSRLIAGAWRWNSVSSATLEQLIHTSLDNGIDTFDHADIYGDYSNEKLFGDVVKRNTSLLSRMKLITKCGIKLLSQKRPEHRIKHYDTSKEHIVESAENSLHLLGASHIDLLLIHRPDPLMDAEEVADAFTRLKQQGKVLHFGVSNFTSSQMDMMMTAFKIEFNQLEISVLQLDPFHDGSLDKCIQHNIHPMSWGPLGSGKLYNNDGDERTTRILAVANILSEKYNCSVEQILLAFLFKHPSKIIPVIGSTKIERLTSAYDATKINIEREEWFMLWRASKGHEIP